ncbi:MAG TPA: IS91 family transposase [Gemmatimonadaceae bacterium]|nr:IS91 family transposase [Gemmatimonadaceae bacterium]
MAAESDLGAIVRSSGETYCRTHRTTAVQRKAMRAIGACRTPALGGQRQQCDHCGYEHIQWHSCRNRACPRCQSQARRQWLEARSAELLPVPYFHVVFTLPEELNVLALHAPRVFYDALFKAVGSTLTDVSRTKLHLNVGALCVLHTWGQTLVLHPHIHCVVPGGGFSADRSRWIAVRKPTFFLPVKVLSRRFRTLFVSSLREAWRKGALTVPARVLPDSMALDLLLARASAKEWVVYAKAPFGGPAQVLGYLANYTHRIAISNSRIAAFDGHHVTFRYRDYADANASKWMTLDVGEFLRRFLMHVVPTRFVRIRYYGFMANRQRAQSIDHARQLLSSRQLGVVKPTPQPIEHHCTRCDQGIMRTVDVVPPQRSSTPYEDSS